MRFSFLFLIAFVVLLGISTYLAAAVTTLAGLGAAAWAIFGLFSFSLYFLARDSGIDQRVVAPPR